MIGVNLPCINSYIIAMKILFCEDDTSIIGIIQHNLSKFNSIELIIARNGSQALRFIYGNGCDMIITAINLPYHSGLEIIEYVRKVKESDVPIILLSAEGFDEVVLHAFRLGINDFIMKPFNPEELILLLHKYLKVE
jgi:DNA-binding response OmpR family regulator